MRRSATGAAAALLLAACGGGSPSRAPEPRDTFVPVQAPPVYALLGQREALGLSSAQIMALDSVGEDLRVRNRAATDSLRAAWRHGGGERMSDRGRRQFADANQPLFQRVSANNQRAIQAVERILTAEQRVRSCELAGRERQERRIEAMERREAGETRAGARRRRSLAMMDPDSLIGRRATWTWCPRAEPRGARARRDTAARRP